MLKTLLTPTSSRRMRCDGRRLERRFWDRNKPAPTMRGTLRRRGAAGCPARVPGAARRESCHPAPGFDFARPGHPRLRGHDAALRRAAPAYWLASRRDRTGVGGGEVIPITRPSIGREEADAAAEAVLSGWLSQGPRVQHFEQLLASYTGARFAVATSNCTTALHLALLAAGVGPGDEVICPSFSFVATANAILYTGARPVFVDIDANTYNIDASLDRARDYRTHQSNCAGRPNRPRR